MGVYDTTVGTLLVGIFFNTFLYGLVVYQFAAYYRSKFQDRLSTKCMVFFLFILDTFHSAAVIYMAWYYTVTNYNNPKVLEVAVWPYQFTPLGTALAAIVTQIFLGFRIWRLTGSNVLFGIVVFLAIPSFILGMVCSIEAWIIKIMSKLTCLTPLVIAWLVIQVMVDVLITAILTVVFYNSKTGYRRTDSVLNRLIRCAIQTGLFATIFSLGDLISFVLFPSSNLYGMFAIPIGRIYTNTLMDSLLARESIRAEMAGTYNIGGLSGAIGWMPSNSSHATSSAQSTSIHLEVKKTIQETYDASSFEHA